MVKYVGLRSILPSLEGEDKKQQRTKQSQQLQRQNSGLEENSTAELRGTILAAHSMQPLSSLCDPSNVALALAAALRLCSLSHRSWSSPIVFCAGITFTTWFYLF